MPGGRLILVCALTALSVGLFVLMLRHAGIGLIDVGRTLVSMPAWTICAIVSLTFANQFLGAARWRAAERWLSPASKPVEWTAAIRTTIWGSFLGQLLPLQLAMPMARWIGVRTTRAVGATLYEQLFDIILLAASAASAALIILLRAPGAIAIGAFLLAIGGACVLMSFLLRLASACTARFAAAFSGQNPDSRLEEALDRAAKAPPRLLLFMSGLAAFRIILMAIRTVLIAVITVPGIDWVIVALGYPVVGIALGMPFVPAGLGIADWTLAGVLGLAGATVASAALATVVLRIVTIIAIAVLLAGSPLLRLLEPANAHGLRVQRR